MAMKRERGVPGRPLAAPDVRRLAERIRSRPRDRVARELAQLDREHAFTRSGRGEFQDLLAEFGAATEHRIQLPADDEPFWFRCDRPLVDYQSSQQLPESADVVVIGAGLTGASSAYHLAQSARQHRIVVLDQGDPAGEASGRNGGNFQLIPENSVGVYEGLAKERLDFLTRLYRTLPLEVLRAESERQASLVLGIALRNRDLVKSIILRDGIDCDYAPRGWLHLTSTEQEEQGICDEVMLAARHGQKVELWSRARIRAELDLHHDYLARFIPGDGTYHPFKYTCGLLRGALHAGVQLYTRTKVHRIESNGPNRHRLTTSRGTIQTRRVIVATNAFTSRLLPQLHRIRAFQSQIMVTEHAPDRLRGRVVTCNRGPIFMNQPRGYVQHGRAPLLVGGGSDRPMRNPSSRRRSPRIHHDLLQLRDQFFPELRGCPPSAEWVGAMGFTPDELPAIGFLRLGVIIAAGFNGYGGSYTTAAGYAAAEMALTDATPEWVPADVFSPRRLLSRQPMFMSQHDSLWRIAASLCRELRRVNREISETLILGSTGGSRPAAVKAGKRALRSPRSRSIDPMVLEEFPVFKNFTAPELELLGRAMRRRQLPRRAVLFTEGSAADSWYVVLSGAVSVTIEARGRQRLLAQLLPGSIFGQVSVLDGEPRSATCTIERAAILAEVDRHASARLLRSRSPISLKLLGVLNDGIVSALRGADRQLMLLHTGGIPNLDGGAV
jgi:glycine/D-amino acid oxidase-like deaminating enzyme